MIASCSDVAGWLRPHRCVISFTVKQAPSASNAMICRPDLARQRSNKRSSALVQHP
jgi:hypothetical protein